jgi:hypothetical protein
MVDLGILGLMLAFGRGKASDEEVWLLLLAGLAKARASSPSSASSPPAPAARPPAALPRAFVPWTPDEMGVYRTELGTLGIPLAELLLLLAVESGLDPHASSGSAWGLHQAQAPLLRRAGWLSTPESFGDLGVAEQLPWIRRMLQLQIKTIGYVPKTSIDLFRMNLSPAAAKSKASVIYDRSQPKQRAQYDANKALDRAGKGRIDLDDLTERLQQVFESQRYKIHLALLQEKGT